MKLCLKENNEEYDLDIKSFQIEPDDIIFIRVPSRLSQSQYMKIKEYFASLFPNNKVMVTSEEIELDIVKNNKSS